MRLCQRASEVCEVHKDGCGFPVIMIRSQLASERVMQHVQRFLERKLRFGVDEKKSLVAR